MENFCGCCGSRLNPANGTCPKCSKKNRTPIMWIVLVIMIALIGIAVCILDGNIESAQVPEQEAAIKQISQIRCYNENEQLTTEVDFTYEQQKITHIAIKSFSEQGMESAEQEYPIDYDAAGRVIRYGVKGLGRYEEFEYDENGMLVRHGTGEGGYVDTFYEYDEQNRLEETLTSADGADFVSHYVYDNTGRCIRRDDYSYYDATNYENRTYDLEVYHYQYDECGNLIELSGDSTATVYEYDELARKASEVTEDEYGFVYTTLYNHDYVGLTICDINFDNNNGFNSGYSSAEIRDANGFLIYSHTFDVGSTLLADEDGYLSQVKNEAGATIEFLYVESK